MTQTNLRKCIYRVVSEIDNNTMYCRHPRVHVDGNIVSVPICLGCTLRDDVCNSFRELPVDGEVIPRPVAPTLVQLAWNVSGAIGAFVSDGFRLVDKETYKKRLGICDGCEHRVGNRCSQCGCVLSLKATARAFQCPAGKWE